MQPWRRIIHSTEQSAGLFGQWIVTLLFAGFSFALFFVFAIKDRSVFGGLISGFFAVLGLVGLVGMVWRTLEQWKFGAVKIALEGAPPALGGEVQALIRLPGAAHHARTLSAEISCVDVTFDTDSKGRQVRREKRIWYHEKSFLLRAGRAEIRLPVADAPAIERGTAYRWQLKVKVDLPGIDLSRTFPLEVSQRPAEPRATASVAPQAVSFAPLPAGDPAVAAASGSVTAQATAPDAPDDVAEQESPAPGWALAAANLVPLGGVAFFGWDVASIVFLYWVENLVIGAFNVMRIAAARPERLLQPKIAGTGMRPSELGIAKTFLAGFFVAHYGAFCAGHGAVLLVLFSMSGPSGRTPESEAWIAGLLADPWLLGSIAALSFSHLLSFLRNYLRRGEYRRANIALLMMRPYGRIFVTHLFILGGGLALQGMQSPLAALIVFIAIKTAIDFAMHRRERRLLAQQAE